MAVRELSKDLVGNITSKQRLPRGTYALRCMEASFGPSQSSGNPMITTEWEIVHPESVKIGEKTFNLAGVKAGKQYWTTMVLNEDKTRNDVKSDAKLANMRDLHERLELPTDAFDDEKPDLSLYKGLVVDAVCSAEEYTQKKEPTAEQIAQGQKYGTEDMLDENGQKIVGFRIRIDNILGKSKVVTNEGGF